MVQNQFDTKIKKIYSGNARDYFNQILSLWFQKEGIIHESSYWVGGKEKLSSSRVYLGLIVSIKCTKILLGRGCTHISICHKQDSF